MPAYFQQLYDWAVKMIKDGKAYMSQTSRIYLCAKGTLRNQVDVHTVSA
jgi:glutamyl/glutaminyl-tRNA synthetase